MLKLIPNTHGSGFTPFSLTVLYGWVIIGFLGIVSFFIKVGGPNVTFLFEPAILEPITSVFVIIGSMLMILSNADWKSLNTSWLVDNIGMLLALGGWVGYLVGVASADPTRLFVISSCLIFIFAIIVRFVFTYTYSRFVKKRVEKLWKTGSIPQP